MVRTGLGMDGGSSRPAKESKCVVLNRIKTHAGRHTHGVPFHRGTSKVWNGEHDDHDMIMMW